MAVVKYSTWLPDGRTLGVEPQADGMRFTLDNRTIDRAEAEIAWTAQPEIWQRGRTLDQALRDWRGWTR
jgi:hypothetical protein